jgi:NAD(P)-dependent dehydrogenase (short-subunit alcohol dehydrogenase family)
MPTVLITGANRGLGLEFARQYAAAGWRVLACCREAGKAAELRGVADASAGRVTLHGLDVSDHGRIAALAAELKDTAIDVLLNNAGVYGPKSARFGQLDYAGWANVLAVNVLAPVRMAECFVEHVARSQRKTMVCLSSLLGSIGANDGGRHYPYRTSKAALNMAVKCMAVDLRDRGVIAVVVHPGWVRTDMGGPNADLAPQESIAGLVKVIDRLGPSDSGRFWNYDGSELPW